MRLVDDGAEISRAVLKQLYPKTGKARIIGITGNPGSGKSTLTDQLIHRYRAMDLKVGVICVDPSSPFSGGAILGDRIRMNAHANDPGVFIRSLATRGHLGGLSASTCDVVSIMDAMGYDIILLETVGVGQDEIEVVRVAHTSVVVVIPGLGDDIQAIKAGLLEIADVFVINKADREGVDRTVKDLRMMQMLGQPREAWEVPLIRTIAYKGDGVDALVEAVSQHGRLDVDSPSVRTRRRAREAHILESMIMARLTKRMRAVIGEPEALLDALLTRKKDPYTESNRLVDEILDGSSER